MPEPRASVRTIPSSRPLGLFQVSFTSSEVPYPATDTWMEVPGRPPVGVRLNEGVTSKLPLARVPLVAPMAVKVWRPPVAAGIRTLAEIAPLLVAVRLSNGVPEVASQKRLTRSPALKPAPETVTLVPTVPVDADRLKFGLGMTPRLQEFMAAKGS